MLSFFPRVMDCWIITNKFDCLTISSVTEGFMVGCLTAPSNTDDVLTFFPRIIARV